MELKTRSNNCDICLHQGDITTLDVDAIVNAANEQLWPGAGVCGAIHRRGGPKIAEECRLIIARIGSLATGNAVITTGGDLLARHVIHAVGPVYDDHDPATAARLLAAAYVSSLSMARENRLRSIAFPCISTGTYGYPADEACLVAIRAVRDDLDKHGGLEKIVFCTFSERDTELYVAVLASRSHR